MQGLGRNQEGRDRNFSRMTRTSATRGVSLSILFKLLYQSMTESEEASQIQA